MRKDDFTICVFYIVVKSLLFYGGNTIHLRYMCPGPFYYYYYYLTEL